MVEQAARIAAGARKLALQRGDRLAILTELTRDEITRTLVDGFFPEVPSSARPATRARAGLTQLGLPYAQDPAITRHLAAFLGRQAGATSKLPGFARRGSERRSPAARRSSCTRRRCSSTGAS